MNEQEQEVTRPTVISPNQLPMFNVAVAIHNAYNASIIRLSNSLNLGAFQPIDDYLYRVYLNDQALSENCCIVQKGAVEGSEPTGLPFEIFISLMTILQIKLISATYSGGGVTVYISDDNITAKVLAILVSRPEFSLWDISCEKEGSDAEKAEAEGEAEAKGLPAPAKG